MRFAITVAMARVILTLLLPTASAFVSSIPVSMSASVEKPPAYTLYSSEMCPYAQRTWITARELGVPFEFRIMELGKDNREDWYLQINPLGKVPAVVCGKDVVYESLVVNEYLCEKFPPGGQEGAAALLPSDPAAKAMVRIVAQRSNDLIKAFFTYLSNKDEETEKSKRETFEKELKMLDEWAAIGAKDGGACGWLCEEAGEGRMTLADIAYFPFLERIDATLEKFKGWSLDDLDVPSLRAWLQKCRATESVAGTLKDPAIWAELYKKFLGNDYFKKAGVAK